MSKKMIAPQTNITIVKPNGMTDHDHLQPEISLDRLGPFIFGAAAVFDGEDDNSKKISADKKNRHGDEKIKQRVHPWRHSRCLLRK